eukprot:315807-Pelagomonas_calceolata.AAC.3
MQASDSEAFLDNLCFMSLAKIAILDTYVILCRKLSPFESMIADRLCNHVATMLQQQLNLCTCSLLASALQAAHTAYYMQAPAAATLLYIPTDVPIAYVLVLALVIHC